MPTHRSKRWIAKLAAAYLGLWGLTALVGVRSVDRSFDRELAQGSVGLGPRSTRMPVARLPFVQARDARNLPATFPDTPWRMRSRGVAVAPFLIVDEAAWHTDALAGFSGRRAVFWFFGFSRWFPLVTYWVS